MTVAQQITGEMVVADVLAQLPQAMGVFVEHGFTALKDAETRRTLATIITVAQAADFLKIDLAGLLDHLNKLQATLAAAGPAARPDGDGPITVHHCPGNIVERYPHLLDIFLRHGFEALQDETLRRTVATMVTLETACRMHGVDADQLVAELNAAK